MLSLMEIVRVGRETRVVVIPNCSTLPGAGTTNAEHAIVLDSGSSSCEDLQQMKPPPAAKGSRKCRTILNRALKRKSDPKDMLKGKLRFLNLQH